MTQLNHILWYTHYDALLSKLLFLHSRSMGRGMIEQFLREFLGLDAIPPDLLEGMLLALQRAQDRWQELANEQFLAQMKKDIESFLNA